MMCGSYTYRYSVRDFLGMVCKYPQLSEVLTPHLNTLSSFMAANKSYAAIDQITVDFNLIEACAYIWLHCTIVKLSRPF